MKQLITFLLACVMSFSLFAQRTNFHFSGERETSFGLYSLAMTGLGVGTVFFTLPFSEDEVSQLNSNNIWQPDRKTMNPYSEQISSMSDWVTGGIVLASIGSVGVLSLTQSNSGKDFLLRSLEFGAVYVETACVTLSTNFFIKNLTQRARPYTYYDSTPLEMKLLRNAQGSFFSMHTSFTAATTFFAASVFTDYAEKSWQQGLLWGTAAVLPVAVATLRVHAGEHFTSDVVAGYAFGALCGWLVPRLHKIECKQNRVQTAVSPFGVNCRVRL